MKLHSQQIMLIYMNTNLKLLNHLASEFHQSANIKPQNIEKHFTPNIPAWCMKPPEILFDLHSGKKSESNPHILKNDFRTMQSRYKNYQQIYTDGSKEDSKVGCAVISDNHSYMQRLPDDSSIFTAAAKAVDLALDFISTCDANNDDDDDELEFNDASTLLGH